jgi:hypothetical protein
MPQFPLPLYKLLSFEMFRAKAQMKASNISVEHRGVNGPFAGIAL